MRQLLPTEILFLSDNVFELEAAVDARMDAILIERPGNTPVCRHDKKNFGAVDTFDLISLAKLPQRDKAERVPPEETSAAVTVNDDSREV